MNQMNQLRDALATCSYQNWERITSLLKSEDTEQREVMLTYAIEHMQDYWERGDRYKIYLTYKKEKWISDIGEDTTFEDDMKWDREPWELYFGVAISGFPMEEVLQHLHKFRSMRELKLDNITSDSLQKLVEIPPMRQLRSLELSWNQGDPTEFGSKGLRVLVRSPVIEDLEELIVVRHNICNDGLKAFVEVSDKANIKRLTINKGTIGDEGVKVLASSPHFQELEVLSLAEHQIGDEGFHALVTSPHLSKLKTLILTSNKISDAGIRSWREATPLPQLQSVELSENPITDEESLTLADKNLTFTYGSGG